MELEGVLLGRMQYNTNDGLLATNASLKFVAADIIENTSARRVSNRIQ